MRLIHTCSGLLSIIGAAFLFATAHALIIGPVDINPPPTKTDGAVKGDPNRVRNATPAQESSQTQDDESEDPGAQIRDLRDRTQSGGDEPPRDSEQAADDGPSDELLDAPVPEGTLTLRQSHELWEQGAYFIDARHREDFEGGHIQYAAWLPSTLFDTDPSSATAVISSIPPDATVVIYCVGGECDASHNTARRLAREGFTDLRIMGAGYAEWVAAGLPTNEGSEP